MIRSLVKLLIRLSPIPLTLGEKIDRKTVRLIHEVCTDGDCCVDVGAHTGDITDHMIKASPSGHHYAFEPLPDLYERLTHKYAGSKVTVLPYALSDRHEMATFQHVVSNPTYSGLKQRRYDRKNEKIQQIDVEVRRMDDCIHADHKVRLIKIDVEGAELLVLKGAQEVIKRDQPIIIFEHGEGGADHYDYRPEDLWDFMNDLDYGIHDLLTHGFEDDQAPLTRDRMIQHFIEGRIFYFVGRPLRRA